jgi:hypothetical protein
MRTRPPLVPAKAGTQGDKGWTPAFAGVSEAERATDAETE